MSCRYSVEFSDSNLATHEMAFTLEKISPSDYEKYQLTDINPFTRRKVSWDQWLIDRERNIYLRVLGAWSRDDPYNIQFHLFWRGALLAISFESKIGRAHV